MLALDIPVGHYEMHIPSNMENIPFKIERPHITNNGTLQSISLHSLIGISDIHIMNEIHSLRGTISQTHLQKGKVVLDHREKQEGKQRQGIFKHKHRIK